MKRTLAAVALAAIASPALVLAQGDGFSPWVDDQGRITVPDEFRSWTHLGTWSVAAEDGQGAAELHVVYAEQATVEHFRRTGAFPDGAVLVKELFSTTTDGMTTGTVSRAATNQGWFVMVKDSQGRVPDNPLWGDGWG